MTVKQAKRWLIGAGLLAAWLLPQLIGVSLPARAQIATGAEFQFTVDSAAHTRYGLTYPATFIFSLPAGSVALTAQYRYRPTEAWQPLPEAAVGERFDGRQIARFDYAGLRAYVSVSFALSSDTVYVRLMDAVETPVTIGYEGLARFYDNRHAAVTISLDDWADYMLEPIDAATGLLAGLDLPHTVSVITGSVGDWSRLQARVTTGYTEVAAHTRNHPCTALDYAALGGYAAQIDGSRADLLANLTLPSPYISAFAQPCGFEDAGVRQAVVAAGLLVDRSYVTSPEIGPIDFAPWQADGAYAPLLPTYVVYVAPGHWEGSGSAADLAEANAAFDTAYTGGGIYHFTDHPSTALWFVGSYLYQHLQYIAGRGDVWYVSLGALYQYHYLQERSAITVLVEGGGTSTFTPTPTATSTATPTATSGPSPTPTATPRYVCVNDPHLQGLWRFEEIAGDRLDSSGHGNTLVDHNTAGSGALNPPQGERYAAMTAVDAEWLGIADADQHGLALTGDYSLAVWLRPNTGGYTAFGLVDKRGSLGGGYQIYFSDGALMVRHRNNWSDDYDISNIHLGGEVPNDDTAWVHLAITYDADSTTLRYYLNGAEVDSATDLDPPSDDHADLIVGREPNGTYYTGYLDELAIFDRTLPASDVQSIYLHHIRDVGPTALGVTQLAAHRQVDWVALVGVGAIMTGGLVLVSIGRRRPARTARRTGQG